MIYRGEKVFYRGREVWYNNGYEYLGKVTETVFDFGANGRGDGYCVSPGGGESRKAGFVFYGIY